MAERGRVVNLAAKEPTPKVTVEAPISTKSDPWDEIELPPLMGKAARADILAAELASQRSDTPIVNMEAVKDLNIPRAKPEGIEVEVQQTSKEIIVRYKGWIVCVVAWSVNSGQFRIKRRVSVAVGEKQTHEYFHGFKEAWRVLMEYGVTPAEFQQAFVDLPPQVEWHFDKCPEGRRDCQLHYKFSGDPRSSQEMPLLHCRRCGSDFSMVDKGSTVEVQLVLRGSLIGAGVPETREEADQAPSARGASPAPTAVKQVPFAKEVIRYQGMGPTKLASLQASGVDSWEKLAMANVEELSRIRGLGGRLALMLIEVAKEKTGG